MPWLTLHGPLPDYNYDPEFTQTREIRLASEGLQIFGSGDNGGLLNLYRFSRADRTPGDTSPSIVRMHLNDASGDDMNAGELFFRSIDPALRAGAIGLSVNAWDSAAPRLEVSAAGVSIGSPADDGTPRGAISGSYRATIATDFSAIPANACVDASVAVPSAAPGAECVVGMPATTATTGAGVTWGCFVWAQDEVVLRTCNVTTAPVDLEPGTYSVRVFNPPLN